MRRVLRTGFYIGITLVWLVAAALGLEVYERGRELFAEWHYKSYVEEQNRRVYRMVPTDEQMKKAKQVAPRDVAPRPESRPLAPPPATPEDAQRAREAFAAQGDEHRNIIAALEGVCVIRYGRDGHYIDSYGEPFLQQLLLPYLNRGADISIPLGLMTNTSALIASGTPHRLEAQRRDPIAIAYYDTSVTPLKTQASEPDGVEVRVRDITDMKPVEAVSPASVADKDSPWEIPCFRYKKNYHNESAFSSYNNFGFRGNDVVVPKPKGLYRIVCIGGSTTEEGNSNDATYPHLLGERLKAELGAQAVEVINCGICGITTYGERRRAADYLALEPDLLLFYAGVNDITHAHTPLWTGMAKPWQKALRRSAFLDRWFNRALLPPDDELAAFMRATTFRNFAAILYAARERGVDVAFCSFAYPTVRWWDFRDRNYLEITMRKSWDGKYVRFATYCRFLDLHNRLTRAFCEKEGLLYIPVAENVHVGMDFFFDVCHVTPLGMELKVNIIAAYLTPYLRQKHVGAPTP